MKGEGARFLLLRVVSGRAQARAVPIGVFPSLAEATAAAAGQLGQPQISAWSENPDGVWRRVDRHGQGFVIHRIDPQQADP